MTWDSQEGEYRAALFLNETIFYNDVVLRSLFPSPMWNKLPHIFQTWMRNFISGCIVYLLSGLLWSFVIYYWKRNLYIHKDRVPSKKSVLLQIYVAMKAMPWYMIYQTISEHIVESGRTKCYVRVSEVGWLAYFTNLLAYLTLVEFGMYWMHRELHHVKPLYKFLHSTHHVYNKQNTLSPFAGLAFHPLDGILQALPHFVSLFIVPIQFRTHTTLLFLEGLWTANIHDTIHGNVWPIMGAGYHTVHHTTYRHNYGHYTVLMDWAFGTLQQPSLDDDKKFIKND